MSKNRVPRYSDFAEDDRAGAVVRAVLPDSARRVSHEDLMAAATSLNAARDKEAAAGNQTRAREINQLALGCYMAAIRVEDLDFLAVPS